jgi:vacuolar-type H+-ATPase subunit H
MVDLLQEAQDKANLTVEKIQQERISLMNCVEGVSVTNDQELSIATDLLKRIKDRMKWLEEDRKSITDPINKSLKLINGKYKPSYEFLELLAKKLDQEKIVPYSYNKMMEARKEAERIKQIEFDRIAAEQEAMKKVANEQGSDIAQEVSDDLEKQALKLASKDIEVSQQFRTADSVTTLRGRWVCEIVDATKIPREFLEPSSTLLNKAVKDGVREIPGCIVKEVFGSATR